MSGWSVWALKESDLPDEELGGEYGAKGLILDVAGHVIIDSLTNKNESN
jgi:hypothetical protein